MRLKPTSTPASNGNKKELRSLPVLASPPSPKSPVDMVEQGSLCL